MNDVNELKGKVEAWVESSGYALELRVARAFARQQNIESVKPSVSYFDYGSEKWREADIVATLTPRNSRWRRLQIVAECKNAKSRPWVIFTDQRRYVSKDEALQRALITADLSERAQTSWNAIYGSQALPSDSPGFSIAEGLRGSHSSGEEDGPNAAYRAVQQVLSGALRFNEDDPRQTADDEETSRGELVQITIPIVVTTAPIFECRLNEAGEVSTVRTQSSSLYAQPQDQNRAPILVQVMSEGWLTDSWLPEVQRTLEFFR